MDIGSGNRPSGTAGRGGAADSPTASLINGVGLRFRETMAGYFSPGESDPARGAELGRVEQSQLRFDVEIRINDLGRFVKISEHSAELTGTVTCARLGGTLPIRDGVFNLFTIDETTGVRQMVYSFRFTATDGATYCLQGTKQIHSEAGESSVLTDMTRLSTTVYRGEDAQAPVYGAGVLVFNLADAPGLVAGMTVENARTPWQKVAAYAAFASFAWGALRDEYLRPCRWFYDTRYENLVVTGNLQSASSTRPFFMFSGVHERGFPWGDTGIFWDVVLVVGNGQGEWERYALTDLVLDGLELDVARGVYRWLGFRNIVLRNQAGRIEKHQRGTGYQCQAQRAKGVIDIPCSLADIADGQGPEVPSQTPDRVDQSDGRPGHSAGKRLGWNCPKRSQHTVDSRAHQADAEEGNGCPSSAGQHRGNQQHTRPGERHDHVQASLTGPVGTARDEDHTHGGEEIGNREKKAHQLVTPIANALESAGQPKQVAISSATLQDVDGGQQQYLGTHERPEERLGRNGNEFDRLTEQCGFEIAVFGRRYPPCLMGMVIDEPPPENQPDERQHALGGKQHAPIPVAQYPAGKWSKRKSISSLRRSPHPKRTARIARSLLPFTLCMLGSCQRELASSTVSQFPSLMPQASLPPSRDGCQRPNQDFSSPVSAAS